MQWLILETFMAEIQLKKLTKRWGNFTAVDDFNLTIADKEFLVLLGPSGCGKTTTMRMIAGLEDATNGDILVDGKKINDLEPKDRDVAMVFQSYALYPNMNVYDNIRFPLKVRGIDKSTHNEKVMRAVKMVELENFLHRKPAELSGGQRQRVALARAIVREPNVFLMDEPLSNLDAKLRVSTRAQIKNLSHELAVTTVYVTHDQVEAMTLADRIVVLESGKIAQIGTPKQLYEQPANLFVAQFVGSPKMNIISRKVAESVTKNEEFLKVLIKNKQAANIGVRPEHFTLQRGQKKGFLGSVSVIEYLGADCFVFVNCGDLGTINVRVEGSEQYMIDEKVSVNPMLEHVHFFDQQGNHL